jgi:hypothetical protein
MSVKRIYQRQAPIFLTSVLAGILVIRYFFEYLPLENLASTLLNWGNIVTAFTILYSFTTLILMHLNQIRKSQPGKRRSIFKSVLIVVFIIIYLAVGLIYGTGKGPYNELIIGTVGFISGVYAMEWAAHYFTPYRALRITSPETAVLFLCFIITTLREMTVISFLFPGVEPLGDWVAAVPAMAVNRAALAAAGVGTLVLGIRALVGREPGIIEMEMQ